MRITWTSHAIERVEQRFGMDKSIPTEMMVAMGKKADDGQKFRLGCGDVVYIFVKDADVLTILTVHKREECRLKPTKQKGYERRSGKRVETEEYSF